MLTLRSVSRSLLQRSVTLRPPVLVHRRHLASSFSMESLKDLRAQSGAPIVECKKALQNTDGDLQAAMDWLREHGAAKASSKVQGRETTEGLVGLTVSVNNKTAALVQIASETDFAGRSSKFVQLVMDVAHKAANDTDLPDGPLTVESFTPKVQTLLDEAIVAIRENLSIVSATKMQVSSSDDENNSILVGYVHNRVDASEAGSAAALVEVAGSDGKDDVDTLHTVGKKLAMHIVAARPEYLTPDDVPEEQVQKEKDILTSQLADTGKPPEIVEKIVQGRLRKFFEGICLTEQAHMIEESNPKVSKVLKESGVVVKRFESFAIS